jgi:hypothetical protein
MTTEKCEPFDLLDEDCEHQWVHPRLATAAAGPLDGEWLVEACRRCGATSLKPLHGGDGFWPIVAWLEAAGCDPHPADEKEDDDE